ncbi:MAG: uracil-DNA glycosylase family protein [Allomuricauda sp.]|nr:MAG: uracil-DNA glycosylase family protein [Allomuricauda sp.]
MFLHKHPYPPFLYPGVEKLIVGTLPPPRFSIPELKEGDVDFCYGSRDGQLWPILNRIFDLRLKFETSQQAIDQRKAFLRQQKIGICDIVESAERQKVDASDLGMRQAKLRDIVRYIDDFPSVHTILFTGGNSKNGPEYFFRRLLKQYDMQLEIVSDEVPRVHKFWHAKIKKWVKTVSLTAPSGAANRAVGSLAEYKKLKDADPNFNTIDYRVMQYQKFF